MNVGSQKKALQQVKPMPALNDGIKEKIFEAVHDVGFVVKAATGHPYKVA